MKRSEQGHVPLAVRRPEQLGVPPVGPALGDLAHDDSRERVRLGQRDTVGARHLQQPAGGSRGGGRQLLGAPVRCSSTSITVIVGQSRTADRRRDVSARANCENAPTFRRSRAVFHLAMSFEQALKEGDLDVARAILDELVDLPDTGGLWMPECYADLAREYDRQGRHDDAIALLERAIELGWGGKPHPRSDIAEFHLRAGRHEEAAAIWAELKASDPDDVWLYNAAGLSYSEIGEHELAVAWLGEGIELAMRTDDPEGIIDQLSDVRRRSLDALGRDLDELEQRVDPFMEEWRSEARAPEPADRRG